MKFTAGFIGCGNMGGTLARAVAAKLGGADVAVCDLDVSKTDAIKKEYAVTAADAAGIASFCKFIFLGVKPQFMKETLDSITSVLAGRNDYILVSMAAGLEIRYIRSCLGYDCPIIRIMPNTPALVGEGMILCAASDNVPAEDYAEFKSLLSLAGKLDDLPERLIDAASAVSGCGPAYAYLFIEALADGAVECGLPRGKAMTYAAQMLLGSAKMVLETGTHPGALKDAVCSPGGTTIAGVHALEADGFRAAAMDAVTAAYERTLELKK